MEEEQEEQKEQKGQWIQLELPFYDEETEIN